MDARKVLLAAVAVVAIALAAPAGASAKVLWLCKPGMRANPCEPSLTTTVFSPAGKRSACSTCTARSSGAADCFYVYPTVRDQQRAAGHRRSMDDVLRSIAL